MPFLQQRDIDKYGLKEPQTYDDLKNIIKVLNDNGITPFALGNKAPWVGAMYCELITNRIGGNEPITRCMTEWAHEDPHSSSGKIMQELVNLKAFPEGFNALTTIPHRLISKRANAECWSWVAGLSSSCTRICRTNWLSASSGDTRKGNANHWLGQPTRALR